MGGNANVIGLAPDGRLEQHHSRGRTLEQPLVKPVPLLHTNLKNYMPMSLVWMFFIMCDYMFFFSSSVIWIHNDL